MEPRELSACVDDGDVEAVSISELLPQVYSELRRLAAAYLAAQRPGHTLQPTALVHEAYLKLASQAHARPKTRAHFLSVAAIAMRHVLVDYARMRRRQKRGAGAQMVALDEMGTDEPGFFADTIVLDDALTRLAEFDPAKSRLLELRYFGGLTNEEIAETVNQSLPTVKRHLSLARAWLLRELRK